MEGSLKFNTNFVHYLLKRFLIVSTQSPPYVPSPYFIIFSYSEAITYRPKFSLMVSLKHCFDLMENGLNNV